MSQRLSTLEFGVCFSKGELSKVSTIVQRFYFASISSSVVNFDFTFCKHRRRLARLSFLGGQSGHKLFSNSIRIIENYWLLYLTLDREVPGDDHRVI